MPKTSRATFKPSTTLFLSLVLFPCFATSVKATTYYVAPAGSDSNPGTQASPFRTIQKAADLVQPGDKIIVRAGIYYERVIMKTYGSASAPIVFEGEQGAIIDGSDATSNWVQAPEVGPGVWKTSTIPYVPWMMTVEGDQEVWRIANRYMDGAVCDFNGNTGYADAYGNGLAILALPANTLVYPYGFTDQGSVRFWDGIEALYGSTGGITYVRFRNGDHPNTKNVHVSPGPTCQFCAASGAGVTLKNISYVTVRGFTIRGARNAVLIVGTDTSNPASANVIEHNQLLNGNMRVRIDGAATGNTIRANDMEMRSYGIASYLPSRSDPGARWPSKPHQRHFYNVDKILVSGVGMEDDRAVGLQSIGSATPTNTTIDSNTLYGGAQGLLLGVHRGTTISRNVMAANFSQHLYFEGDATNLQVFDNLFANGGQYNLRTNSMEQGGSYYFYRNRFWMPHATDQIYLATDPNNGGIAADSSMDLWFYHNSVAGGIAAFITPFKPGYGPSTLKILNNIFSADNVVFNGWPETMGVYDYNWQYRDTVNTSWSGPNNVFSSVPLWTSASFPDFRPPADSTARSMGVDLSRSFTVSGKTYPALPGMTPGYFSGSRPDAGALQTSAAIPLLGDLDGDGQRNLTDVRWMIEMLVGTRPKNLATADLNKDGTLTLADCQALIRLIVGA